MSKPLSTNYTFLKGAISSQHFVAIMAVVDDLGLYSPTQIYGWLGDDWYDFGTYGWSACGICIIRSNNQDTIICVGDSGEVAVAAKGGFREIENISRKGSSLKHIGKLRTVRSIDNVAVAVGVNRQVYIRKSAHNWEFIDKDTRCSSTEKYTIGFEDIDGFSLNDMYAVGWRGEIWQYDGNVWLNRTSPTNQILTAVCCGGDGNVYVCGRCGLLIVGKEESWEIIEQEDTIEDFWSMTWYRKKLHLSTRRGVYILEENKLSLINFDSNIPSTYYDITTDEDTLCSIGKKDIMLFNCNNWQRLD